VLCPASQVDELVGHIRDVVAESYPTLAYNNEYSCIVNSQHHTRLSGLLLDAEAKGARRLEFNPADEALDAATGKIAPVVLLDVDDSMAVMREEIFGPLLPIIPYGELEDAIRYVNSRPRPLALYYFDRDSGRARHLLERTMSGGACINETVFHYAVDDMPFGGVGPSGIGAYHGKEGFETFSHKKSVFYQSRFNGVALLSAPYGDRVTKILGMMLGR
jgi:coniferyl-aldehyde dehydrogenase